MGNIATTVNRSRQRSESVRHAVRSASPSDVVLAGGDSRGSVFETPGQQRATLEHHAEQYRHFQGTTWSVIRTIANRVMGQPLRVARVVAPAPRGSASARRPSRFGQLERSLDDLVPDSPLFKNISRRAHVLEDHVILRVMENPNPIMTRAILWFVTLASWELTGKSFWWMRWSEAGEPEIWPLPSSWVQPLHEGGKLFTHWRVRPASMTRYFDLESWEVCYFHFPDPATPLGALSPLQAMSRSVVADEAIEEANRRAFLNGANPGLALTIGRHPEAAGVTSDSRPVLNKDQRNQILAAVKAQYRGVLNQEEPLILDGLIQDAKRITLTPRELDFLQSRRAVKSSIAQGWGVNPISMGEIEGANRASSTTADDHLVNNVANPRIEVLSEVMTHRVGPFFAAQGEELLVYLEKARADDPDYDLEVEESLGQAGGMSVNERRQRHGLPPIKDGDVAYLPNGTRVDVVRVKQQQRRPLLLLEERRKGSWLAWEKSGYTTLHRRGLPDPGKVWQQVQAAAEERMRAGLAEFFASVGKQLAEEIGQSAATLSDERLAAMTLDESKWVGQLRAAAAPHVQACAALGAVLEWELHRPRRSWELFDAKSLADITKLPGAIAAAVKAAAQALLSMDFWGGIVRRVRRAVAAAFQTAKADGLTDSMAASKAIAETLSEEAAADRAVLTARTETTTALGAGQNVAQRVLHRMGAVRSRRWSTMEDSRVRPSHREADGQTVGVDQPFIIGGYKCQYPGDPSLPAEQRLGCRCYVAAVAD